MKVLNVLLTENAMLMYRDLTDDQAITLGRVAKGAVTFETGSGREKAIMQELSDLGLVSEYDFNELTQKGQEVARMAVKYGPRDARIKARRQSALGVGPFNKDRKYSDVGDTGDNVEAGDDVVSLSGMARTVDRGHIGK